MNYSQYPEKLLQGYAPTEGLNQGTPRILSVEEFSAVPLNEEASMWAGAVAASAGTDTLTSFVSVSGRFGEGDEAEFYIYLPPKELWKGRFFQRAHPFLGLEAVREDLEFYADSGAYTITVQKGLLGHVAHASAAHVSRTVAKNFYGYEGKIYGYLYGGSGGSMQSIGALEVSTGSVWDGVIPFITAASASLGNFDIRWFARAVLDEKGPLIADAVRAGGRGDPYAELNELERDILDEVTKLGLSLKAWGNYEYLFMLYNRPDLIEGLNSVGELSAEYTEAFWNEPGYLEAYAPELRKVFYNLRERGVSAGALAKISYHRHKDPGSTYLTWDHLRDSDGNPLYAQTEGEHYAKTSSFMTSGGSNWSGKINHKCIVVTNLMDLDAFPVDGDYYRRRVDESGRSGDFRIWLNENADHHGAHDAFFTYLNYRLVDYSGIISQALLDLSAWVENGTEPPVSTVYEVAGSQIVLEENAAMRGGIQPGVCLTADGFACSHVTKGQSVSLSAKIRVPKGTGEIAGAEWDFLGNGNFTAANFDLQSDGSWAANASHTYDEAGTYFPQIRVYSLRCTRNNSPFTRAYNLGRARVVVK